MEQTSAFITPVMAGRLAFGWASQTTYNHISLGTFPFTLYRVVTKKMVRAGDVQTYVDKAIPIQAVTPSKRLRGRPTKRLSVK